MSVAEEMAELEEELGVKFAEIVQLNNLSYCARHFREICHACRLELPQMNEVARFELPKDGTPEYPQVTLTNITDIQCQDLLASRWLDIQRVLYSKPTPNKSFTLTADMFVLPPIDGSDDVKCSPSLSVMQQTLLRLFQQAHGMAFTQRFDFASMSQILLQDYETFSEASHLYKELLADIHGRRIDMMSWKRDPSSSLHKLIVKMANRKKAKATLLSTFSFFLDLKTQHTFWRSMELTAEGFVKHVEMFNQESDGDSVLTDAANHALLEWMGHMFWALQHAQYQLKCLWFIQHEVYNRGTYPFYPYDREALEACFDVYLIIMKLCKAELHDFGSVPPLLKELQEANKFPKQMQFVNSTTMAAIDEFSTRLRVLQILYYAAQLVVSEDEIKSALLMYPFNPEGAELHAKTLDVVSEMCDTKSKLPDDLVEMFRDMDISPPPPDKPSFLQNLIMMENAFRKQHSAKMSSICPIRNNFEVLTKEMFEAFKLNFSELLRDHIRHKWRDYEHSLLPLHVLKHIQHWRDVEKERRRLKNKRPARDLYDENGGKEIWANASVESDASLFWEVGDGSLEPYVPPVLRKKIKTRKEDSTHVNKEGSADMEMVTSIDGEELEALVVSSEPRMLYQLKSTDYETRDVLWGKKKGCLKWSSLLQLLKRIGCKILSLDGSKKKVVDLHTGLSTVLHIPHPGDTCRIDQRKLYCDHIKDHFEDKISRPGRATQES